MSGAKEGHSEFANSSPRLSGWQLRRHEMSEKKRTTVTTIETHEVWIIRKAVPEPADEAGTLIPTEITPSPAISSSSELNNRSETNEEEEP